MLSLYGHAVNLRNRKSKSRTFGETDSRASRNPRRSFVAGVGQIIQGYRDTGRLDIQKPNGMGWHEACLPLVHRVGSGFHFWGSVVFVRTDGLIQIAALDLARQPAPKFLIGRRA